MEHLVRKYKRGEISFEKFVEGTEKYWHTMAGDMLNKWDHPAAVERDDLVQEMILASWKGLESWQDGKGVSGRKWVVFGAMKSARRWLHIQRGAKAFAKCRGDKDPSPRYPICADIYGDWVSETAWNHEHELLPQEAAMALEEFVNLAENEVDEMVINALQELESPQEVIALMAMIQRDGQPNRSRSRKKNRGDVWISKSDLARAKSAYLEFIDWLTDKAGQRLDSSDL